MMNKHFNEAVEGDDGGLVICRGCKAQGTYTELPNGECPTPFKPDRVLLEESKVREQALQLRLNAADQRVDDAAQYMRRTVDLVMQGCGNSYANAWCEKLLVIAKSFGAYNGATIGNIIDLREALQAANDFAIIGIERMPPMEYDEP